MMNGCRVKYAFLLTLFPLIAALPGCAFKKKCDPFEGINRGVFVINKALDSVVLRPTARLYQVFVPKFFQNRLNCFFQNLGELPTIANDVLQMEGESLCSDTARFVLNTTLGIGGLFDVAELKGLKRHYADFGQTLGRWGYRDSVYIVLPFFGPSTVRDSIGRAVTYGMTVWPYLRPERLNWTLYILNIIDTRANYLKFEPMIDAVAFDEYLLIRDAYLQRRACEITVPGANVLTETSTLKGPPE